MSLAILGKLPRFPRIASEIMVKAHAGRGCYKVPKLAVAVITSSDLVAPI